VAIMVINISIESIIIIIIIIIIVNNTPTRGAVGRVRDLQQ